MPSFRTAIRSRSGGILLAACVWTNTHAATVQLSPTPTVYPDGRPAPRYRLDDLRRWNPAHKAVVLDSKNCRWSPHIIGLPSVVAVGSRLAVFYDGCAAETMPAGVKSHMNRDVGLAWLDLPLVAPQAD